MTLAIKTAQEVRTDFLRTMNNALIKRGVANPNTGYGSDYYVTGTALGVELEPLYAAAQVMGEQLMPDTATGVGLDQWLAVVGLARRSPGVSTGKIIYDATASAAVATGQELTDPNTGSRFTVITGGTYADGDSIDVRSVAVGLGSNLAGGTVLKWTTPPVYAAGTAAFDADGATGGVDQEDDETARTRLLSRLRNPPGGGNSSQVAELAEDGSVSIQKAFVYPACNGPSTCHVALAGYASASTTKRRDVNSTIITLATSSVQAFLPEFAESVITTVENDDANVSFGLQLPDSTTATAGQATGWVNSIPWPSITGATQKYTAVTLVTSTTAFRVESAVAPLVGETVAWIDRSTFAYHTAKVLTASEFSAPSLPGTMGVYAVTIDTPFAGVAVADWVFPAAVNGQTYATAVLSTFAMLGPGEKTDVAGVLPRAYRRPRYFESWSYQLGGNFTKALTNAGDEVLDSSWHYQNGGQTSPSLPSVISDPPRIFTPKYIAWYPI